MDATMGPSSLATHAADGVPAAALAELAATYRDLDRELARLGVECRACGRCCDFARNDYRLYASFLERAPLVRRHGPPRLTAAGYCGFLVDGRCSARDWRPLGCRTFFCDPQHKARELPLYQAFQRRLRAATDRHRLPWDYAPFFPAPVPGPGSSPNSVLP